MSENMTHEQAHLFLGDEIGAREHNGQPVSAARLRRVQGFLHDQVTYAELQTEALRKIVLGAYAGEGCAHQTAPHLEGDFNCILGLAQTALAKKPMDSGPRAGETLKGQPSRADASGTEPVEGSPSAHSEFETGRDWTEDAAHENGGYQCQCVECGQLFHGHKRRHVCKLCSDGSRHQSCTKPSMTTFEIRSWLAPATGGCEQQVERLLAHLAELEQPDNKAQ